MVKISCGKCSSLYKVLLLGTAVKLWPKGNVFRVLQLKFWEKKKCTFMLLSLKLRITLSQQCCLVSFKNTETFQTNINCNALFCRIDSKRIQTVVFLGLLVGKLQKQDL